MKLLLIKVGRVTAAVTALVVASGIIMFILNSTPVAPAAVPSDSTAAAARPFVVKVHARWCPACMLTKGVWMELQEAYASKANLVVFDVTSEKTIKASRAEAKRLGLESFFEAHAGDLGSVHVLDGASKEIVGSVSGSRNLADYAELIDNALKAERN